MDSFIIKFFTSNYFNFRGRASRKEFWSVQLVLTVLFTILPIAVYLIPPISSIIIIIFFIFLFASFIPSIALCFRRLHDIGLPGYVYFLLIIPNFVTQSKIISLVIILIFCLRSHNGDNKYGPHPIYEHL